MKRFLVCFLLFSATKVCYSQPNLEIPGEFIFDICLNHFDKSSEKLPLKTWGSRGFNIYYLYEIEFFKKKLSLNLGCGVSSEKFSFAKDITLKRLPGTDFLQISPLPPNWRVRKTLLTSTYLDFPLELRFQTAPGYKAFRVALGFRIGKRLSSHTKIKYREKQDYFIIRKEQNNFLITEWRYGIMARIGLDKINFFASYNFTPLFQAGATAKQIDNYSPAVFAFGITFYTF